jgi:hypothetical protein
MPGRQRTHAAHQQPILTTRATGVRPASMLINTCAAARWASSSKSRHTARLTSASRAIEASGSSRAESASTSRQREGGVASDMSASVSGSDPPACTAI